MAYPVEDALRAAVGDERFWDLCPSMMVCGGNKWGGFDDFSEEIYNARDKTGSDGLTGLERAKKIIEEKGLVGSSVIVFAVCRPAAGLGGPAEISRQTLEELGFDVDFKVTDWATQTNWREKPELWGRVPHRWRRRMGYEPAAEQLAGQEQVLEQVPGRVRPDDCAHTGTGASHVGGAATPDSSRTCKRCTGTTSPTFRLVTLTRRPPTGPTLRE